MSMHIIKMPDLGEGIAEVELVAWHVKPGDAIEEDQVLADVMTDKATVEIPSPVAGTVAALGGEVGEVLAVGAELIRIDTAGSAGGMAAPPAAADDSLPVAPDAAAAAGDTPAPTVTAAAAAPVSAASAQTAERAAAARTADPAATPSAARASGSAAMAVTAPAAAAPRKVIASPAVRARAWELGIDLAAVEPSGTAGRVMQADLESFTGRSGSRPSAVPAAPAGSGAAAAAVRRPPATGATDTVRVIGLRRRIAQKMQDSKRRIPHYAYVEEVDVTELEALRLQLNQRHGAERGRLTLLPLLIRAIVRAAPDFPEVNAVFDDEAGVLTRHASVHVGIATQTDAGLMVPVLRDAQAGDLWQHAAEIARLAQAARSGKAVRDELTGSTITVTSLGKLGGIVTTPVINHPEVAIVGVNKMVDRPMVRGGAVVIRQMMNLSSSFDHRVVDGAQAAAFIQRVREALEHPGLLFVE